MGGTDRSSNKNTKINTKHFYIDFARGYVLPFKDHDGRGVYDDSGVGVGV